MAYVIAEPCIGTKDNSCVEVCPVDCIHPTPDEPDYDKVEQLYIDPEECIDCDACVEACPVDACFAEDQLPDEWQRFAQVNAEYFARPLTRLATDLSGPDRGIRRRSRGIRDRGGHRRAPPARKVAVLPAQGRRGWTPPRPARPATRATRT